MAGKTTLIFLKTLRGFRKLFMDHISKRSKKGVEDKTGVNTSHGASGFGTFRIDIFKSIPQFKQVLGAQSLAPYWNCSTYCTCHPDVSQPFFVGKLQNSTSKSKVHCQNQTVSHTPNKNHWTPHSCDEEKQLRLQSQHNFLPFSRKRAHLQVLPLCRS